MYNDTTDLASLSADEKRRIARELLRKRGMKGSAEKTAQNRPEEIKEEYYRPELFPGYQQLEKNKRMMERIGVSNPYFNCREDTSNNTITIQDKPYINFSGYNYLGLSGEKRICDAVKAAVDRYGTSASASRIVSGEFELHRELEAEIAKVLGTRDCVVSVGGYSTNVSTIGYLMDPQDIIFVDSLVHNSIMTGCQLAGWRRVAFPHNDWAALDKLMAENRAHYKKALVIIEGVYSMDGDISDLPRFIEVKKRHKALIMVDEAHSMGVLGKRGFGMSEYFGSDPADVDIWMGTLSKSLSSCGGYIAGSRALVQDLKYNAPGSILYSVGISPANAAAALESLRMLQDEPERVESLRQRSEFFLNEAKKRGLDTGPSSQSPVIPVILGNSARCLKLGEQLFRKGINVQAILYPAVPEDASRLRFFITAMHTEEEILYTLDNVAAILQELRNEPAVGLSELA
ncbi:MAG: aminotransferase class I/II-fold pyridoxal phosphate-dependent enzyme [Gammaproteobacteria bacterium]